MFHRLLGWYCSYCAAQLVTGTSERIDKQNITIEWTPHPQVWGTSWTRYSFLNANVTVDDPIRYLNKWDKTKCSYFQDVQRETPWKSYRYRQRLRLPKVQTKCRNVNQALPRMNISTIHNVSICMGFYIVKYIDSSSSCIIMDYHVEYWRNEKTCVSIRYIMTT